MKPSEKQIMSAEPDLPHPSQGFKHDHPGTDGDLNIREFNPLDHQRNSEISFKQNIQFQEPKMAKA